MLTLYNVTEEESGEYICKVSNYIGEANQSAWLTVTKYDPAGNHTQQCKDDTLEALQGQLGKLEAYSWRRPQLFLSSLPLFFSSSLFSSPESK